VPVRWLIDIVTVGFSCFADELRAAETGQRMNGMDTSIGGERSNETQRRRSSKRGLGFLTLTFIGLVVLFVGRNFWPIRHLATGAARGVKERTAAQRLAAIHELERLGPEDPTVAIPALRGCLEDQDAEVRAAAATALVMVVRGAGKSRSAERDVRRVVAALLGGTADSQPEVRSAVVQALWMIAVTWEGSASAFDLKEIHDVLLKAADDPDATVRLSALRGLGVLGPKVAADVPPVLLRALEDASEPNRTAAAEALVHFPSGLPRVLPSLVRSFERTRPEYRTGYANVLMRMQPRAFDQQVVPVLAAVLDSTDAEIRYLAATSLGAFDAEAEPAIPALIRSASRGAPTPVGDAQDPVLAAAQTLLKIMPAWHVAKPRPVVDAESFAALAKVLKSGRPEVRATVAAVLGRCEPRPEAVAVLGESVQDPDATVRTAALRALHDIGDRMPFVPPQTLHAALEDESSQVRFWAAGALGHAGRGIDPFLPALIRHAEQDADPEVREVCADEIGAYIKPAAVTTAVVPALIEALASPAQRMRCASCGMLGRFGPTAAPAIPAVIRVLERGLHKPNERPERYMTDQRSWAATALGRIAPGTPKADEAAAALVEALEADPTLGDTSDVIEAIARFGPAAKGAIPRLRALAQDPHASIREAAQNALATLEGAP